MKLKRFDDNVDKWEIDSTTLKFEKIKKENKWLKMILYITSVILIFFIIKISYHYYDSHRNDFMFKKYYAIENVNPPITRGDKNIEAIIKFEQKDFKTSNAIFNEILKSDSTNTAILFYNGISNIELKNYQESIKSFKYIIEQKDNLYVEDAEWHLALCYLKIKDNCKAKEIFKHIASEKSNYSKDAKEILKKLE